MEGLLTLMGIFSDSLFLSPVYGKVKLWVLHVFSPKVLTVPVVTM